MLVTAWYNNLEQLMGCPILCSFDGTSLLSEHKSGFRQYHVKVTYIPQASRYYSFYRVSWSKLNCLVNIKL